MISNDRVAADQQLVGLSTLLQLEKEARLATTVKELQFFAVNESHRLLSYRQAVLWRRTPSNRALIEAVSGLAKADEDAPYVLWLHKVIQSQLRSGAARELTALGAADVDRRLRRDWAEWTPAHVLWCPLVTPNGELLGGLWLTRDQVWQANEQTLAQHLADAYAHAWAALTPRRGRVIEWLMSRKPLLIAAAVAVLAAILAIPVEQTVLAPLEVVPSDPWIATAPHDGVVKVFHIVPNEHVQANQPLFSLDDTALRNQHEFAAQALEVANAELRRAEQQAFTSTESRAQIALFRLRVEQRVNELAYMAELLERIDVRPKTGGIAVFSDVNDWIGRPVRVGERILMVADSQDTELLIMLSVEDAIPLDIGARVIGYLNIDPLNPIEASLRHESYEAEVTKTETLAYRLKAELVDGHPPPRIGLKGTAKIYGERVSLFYFLMRRPLSFLRQFFGV